MTGDDPVPGVGDADQGPLQIVIAVPHGFIQSTLRGSLGALQDVFTTPVHFNSSFKVKLLFQHAVSDESAKIRKANHSNYYILPVK